MSGFYRHFLRPALFIQDSEKIHDRTLKMLGRASRHKKICDFISTIYAAPELPIELCGLKFPNPVGLAAGLDKDAVALPVWEKFGFGFCELGGVTWHPQSGNPKPRLFRAVDDQALINRMGFNNSGAEVMAEKLANWKKLGRWPAHPVGINLGKSKITPLDHAAGDYANSFRILKPWADFFVVNVSSPNTPELTRLQNKNELGEILSAIQEINASQESPVKCQELETQNSKFKIQNCFKPILVKVSPDLSFATLDKILELVAPRRIAGIIATNTTTSRPRTKDPSLQKIYSEPGGLSGRPLRSRSNEVICHLYKTTRGALPIIGVGGIFNAEHALAKIMAGASLVQLYSGLIYEGPAVAKNIVSGLRARLREEGFQNLNQAVGAAVT